MTYKMTIIQDFKGKLNSVEFDNRTIYYSVAFLLDQLEEKELNYNDDVITELKYLMEYLYGISDGNDWGRLESEIADYILTNGRVGNTFYFNNVIFEDVNVELDKLNQ